MLAKSWCCAELDRAVLDDHSERLQERVSKAGWFGFTAAGQLRLQLVW